MKKNADHKWIILAGSSLVFSTRFLETLSDQLLDLIWNTLNVDLRVGFLLDLREYHWVDEENIAYLEGDLIGPDNSGHYVRIAWKCEKHPYEQIFPSDPLNPENNHKIKVWWAHFPIDKIKEYLNSIPSRVPDTGELSFDIKWLSWWDKSLPDLNFYLKVTDPLLENELDRINEQLWQVLMNPGEKNFQELITWITSRTFSGQNFSFEEVKGMSRTAFVKYSSGIVKNGNNYRLSLDFQLACDATIAYWLKGLDEISEQLSIEQVIVGNLIESFD